MEDFRFLGFTIFQWDEWDDLDFGWCQYYHAQFQFNSMKQYNGAIVNTHENGEMTIYAPDGSDDEYGNPVVAWQGFITDIPEMRTALIQKWGSET